MILGTRTSALAWAQSSMVAGLIGPDVRLVGVETAGDKVVDAPLRGPLVKGWFTEALEERLRTGEIDIAVHSLKDLPVANAEGLVLGAILERGPVADMLLVRSEAFNPASLGLPIANGARVGMSSPRRESSLRTVRPDCTAAFLRGNVTTRIQRLAEGKYDAIVLAEAGLLRLGTQLRLPPGVRVARLDPRWWVPAPGQGALAVQCREGDSVVRDRLSAIHHPQTAEETLAERAALSLLGGGCSVPFGAWWSGARWTVGLDVAGTFSVRTGIVAPAAADSPNPHAEPPPSDWAVRALALGERGETWPTHIAEVQNESA